jgi:hypothetical protein
MIALLQAYAIGQLCPKHIGNGQMLSRLEQVRFRKVGCWRKAAERPEYEREREHKTYNVLYAFKSGNEILYIEKTTIALRDRKYCRQALQESVCAKIARR